MAISSFNRLAFRLFGKISARNKSIPAIDETLRKARMPVRADALLASAWLAAMLTSATLVAIATAGIWYAVNAGLIQAQMYALVPIMFPLGAYLGYWTLMATPASEAKKRGKTIDVHLPYATNYIAAMASAGVIPQDIFRSLARQKIYGEVATEAIAIYKDLEVHGKDINTALRRAIYRTPSVKFEELLQGAITTISSGGDLTQYFRQRASRYQWENRVEQRSFIETMGLMAETYVTAAVAGPLFLLVIVAIIVLMGGGPFSNMQMIIYLLIPIINIGFMMGLKSMIPEV